MVAAYADSADVMTGRRPEGWVTVSRMCHRLVMVGLLTTLGCSPLEPIVEPEVSDLQLTVDTLRTSIREAQKTVVDLRAELEAQRQELADAQIARAQLEGRVREAERRLAEARHVIELQREELASSRSERERVARSGASLQKQMKQLQQQLARLNKPATEGLAAGAAPASFPSQGLAAALPATPSEPSHLAGSPAMHVSPGAAAARQTPAPALVVVKSGDTLFSLARRHRISVKRLMAINQLRDSRIEVGQALWLSDPIAGSDEGIGHLR